MFSQKKKINMSMIQNIKKNNVFVSPEQAPRNNLNNKKK